MSWCYSDQPPLFEERSVIGALVALVVLRHGCNGGPTKRNTPVRKA